MTRIIQSLAEISAEHDALYCDLWGCLHNGKAPYPAAVAALRAFRAKGGKVMLLTNAPRPLTSVKAQLTRLGVPDDCWDGVTSSGDAAQLALVSHAVGQRVHHIGPEKDLAFFDDLNDEAKLLAAQHAPIERVALKDAQGIVCTGLRDDLSETPADYRAELMLAKQMGLPMLCANPDIVVHLGETLLWCAGALARDYEEMGGKVIYSGKPHPPIYDLAARRLGALGAPENPRILCVGDGVNTDVQGGISEGLDVLFITGGIDFEAFGADPENPDPALLDAWLDERQLAPTAAMGRLG